MNFLMDTHIFLWIIFDNEKLSEKIKKIYLDHKNNIFVSSITFWEISLKYSMNKITLSGITPDDLPNVAISSGMEILDISIKEMASFHRLPKIHHKDPFDRMIIWQCIINNLVLISKDRSIKDYEKFGLKAIN